MNDRSKAAENERKKRITTKTLEAAENELAKVKDDLTITTRERDNVSAGLASCLFKSSISSLAIRNWSLASSARFVWSLACFPIVRTRFVTSLTLLGSHGKRPKQCHL